MNCWKQLDHIMGILLQPKGRPPRTFLQKFYEGTFALAAPCAARLIAQIFVVMFQGGTRTPFYLQPPGSSIPKPCRLHCSIIHHCLLSSFAGQRPTPRRSQVRLSPGTTLVCGRTVQYATRAVFSMHARVWVSGMCLCPSALMRGNLWDLCRCPRLLQVVGTSTSWATLTSVSIQT